MSKAELLLGGVGVVLDGYFVGIKLRGTAGEAV